MRINRQNYFLLPVLVILLAGLLVCAKKDQKIPITTSSKEAKQAYLQGRDLAEKLRNQDARPYFLAAMDKDPDFALAHLGILQAAISAKEFFNHLNKAVALADKVSEGERLMIEAFKAGVDGFPVLAKEKGKKLVQLYPRDERAHNLLGGLYFGTQEWEEAIAEYQKAIAINPEFSSPYNQLGYAYRFLGQYDQAKQTFKKYIELIPDDPNPYDSFAELLLKMGEYDSSIEQYRKALDVDSQFVASHIGIATNLNYMEKHDQALEELDVLYNMARNDGERGAALFAMAVSYVDAGDMEMAIATLKKQLDLDKKNNDVFSISVDLDNEADVLMEWGAVDKAEELYNDSYNLVMDSKLSEQVKENKKIGNLFDQANILAKRKEFAAAEAKADEYLKAVTERNNKNLIRVAHQLYGIISLDKKDYDMALQELEKSNLLNPYNLYRMGLAFKHRDNVENAKEYFTKAANFNALNSLNQAFIRQKANKMLEGM